MAYKLPQFYKTTLIVLLLSSKGNGIACGDPFRQHNRQNFGSPVARETSSRASSQTSIFNFS